MTDLLHILPSFRTAPFGALLPIIEQHALSTTDLLALHPADISKQTNLPLLDLKRLIATIQVSLSDDLVPRHPLQQIVSSAPEHDHSHHEQPSESNSQDASKSPAIQPQKGNPSSPSFISTLCPQIDAALNSGIPTSSITEITGESGAGKTQFLLSLCLAVQLPPPHGLRKQALYISTESSLATKRLSQILASNPLLQGVDFADRPSLDNILSTVTPDLESQDHILEYQVPVLLSRHNIGLLVIDSVAANYRAEFERAGSSYGSNMAARSAELVRLGALLRDLARRHGIAVVVANQDFCFRAGKPPRIKKHAAAAAAIYLRQHAVVLFAVLLFGRRAAHTSCVATRPPAALVYRLGGRPALVAFPENTKFGTRLVHADRMQDSIVQEARVRTATADCGTHRGG
ncbi:hypothetical protein MHUMG1_00793 [Metarhizium humberi]|uniref:RecA family profile 1 domain-containing protein n=1 Tax=Metarhizium humberi TaxID=2596975 RepID=A0A9P8MMA4_9HYPO|nr:hypothetical protein MHUMG1_00793 [Metarhizium humberi]